ncbi:MAG TPA: DMT family transporter [Chloroflexota bacterium]|nr:DMT family transporter [Chloroflexota bacterium]
MIAAIVLCLVAAALNAAWNALLKTSGDPMAVATRAMSASALAVTPLVAIAWLVAGEPTVSAGTFALAGGSSVAEFIYFLCLTTAYRRGELSVVYPLARGSAPLLAVIAGVVVLREALTIHIVAGVLLLGAGILIVRTPSRAAWNVMAPALMTGAAIATYSAIDKVGTGQAPPWLYGWFIWCGGSLLLVGWAGAKRLRRTPLPAEPGSPASTPPTFRLAATIGGMMLVSYLMVLFALSLAPLVVVAPLRESGIVLVTAVGAWRLGERAGFRSRISGSLAILGGVLVLAL